MILGIDPKNDYAFKFMFGSVQRVRLLIHLLNSVLQLPSGRRFVHVEILNPITEKTVLDEKLAILDVRAGDETGRQFNIEMQMIVHPTFRARFLYYWSKLYGGQLIAEDQYEKLRPVVSICFLDGLLFSDNEEWHFHFRLRDADNPQLVYSDHLQIHVFQLPNLRNSCFHNQFPLERTQMNNPRMLMPLALLAICWCPVTFGGRQPYNRYTGGQTPTTGQHNPYTGRRVAQPAYNPYTGRRTQPAAQRNAYTGTPQARVPSYNPLMTQSGAGQTRMATTTAWPLQDFPISGKAGPGLKPFDRAILSIMTRHGIPGAALAIAKDGRLVYAKGFGWADLASAQPVEPGTVFGLASLSKPITAMAILLLIQQGKLNLNDSAFAILNHIGPPRGRRADKRIGKITIRHLLNHSGGWDRKKSGDPVNWAPRVAKAMGLQAPITAEQLISFTLGTPLDFEPGTQHQYSNIGYITLGQVIEKVSAQPYEEFVYKNILAPMGIRRAMVNHKRSYPPGVARRYLAGTSIMLPPMQSPMLTAAGGWNVSTVGMVRFLTAIDGSRGNKPFLKKEIFETMIAPPPPPLRPRANGSYPGLGWPVVFKNKDGFGYVHDGLWHGIRTFMKRSPKGINWVLAFNVTMQPDMLDSAIIKSAVQEVRGHVEQFDRYPDIDLFKEFR